ncbi:hypothetical protein ERE_33230 [Agathobacter rectalis M104/1]|nr:hypothetical protein ERE_33230 [Agathobacter rectalis M104/1]
MTKAVNIEKQKMI